MPVSLHWGEVAVRLAVTLAVGLAFGLNRGEAGKPAGLRTTTLVCLAASVAMLLTNYLLMTTGKQQDSFVQIDALRIPLGVLTGVGFIGAGTIIQRRDLVVGVTTAATLWFVTVVGLCIGAGYIALGLAAGALGLLVLWGLAVAEKLLPHDMRATLVLCCTGDDRMERELLARMRDEGLVVTAHKVALTDHGRHRESRFNLRWRGVGIGSEPPLFLAEVARDNRVVSLHWDPIAR